MVFSRFLTDAQEKLLVFLAKEGRVNLAIGRRVPRSFFILTHQDVENLIESELIFNGSISTTGEGIKRAELKAGGGTNCYVAALNDDSYLPKVIFYDEEMEEVK